MAKETVSYVEVVPLSYEDPKHRVSTEEVSAEATQEPNCVEATVSSDRKQVIVRVEREFAVEMIAETKVTVLFLRTVWMNLRIKTSTSNTKRTRTAIMKI